ncbi:MAG: Spermidine/putrescine import ABC transporter permease protein PotC, partial [uncultured Rubellimicrobium sp.]
EGLDRAADLRHPLSSGALRADRAAAALRLQRRGDYRLPAGRLLHPLVRAALDNGRSASGSGQLALHRGCHGNTSHAARRLRGPGRGHAQLPRQARDAGLYHVPPGPAGDRDCRGAAGRDPAGARPRPEQLDRDLGAYADRDAILHRDPERGVPESRPLVRGSGHGSGGVALERVPPRHPAARVSRHHFVAADLLHHLARRLRAGAVPDGVQSDAAGLHLWPHALRGRAAAGHGPGNHPRDALDHAPHHCRIFPAPRRGPRRPQGFRRVPV